MVDDIKREGYKRNKNGPGTEVASNKSDVQDLSTDIIPYDNLDDYK